MKNNKRTAMMFCLAAVCFLVVGIMHYGDRPLLFYGNIAAGILWIIAAIRSYTKKSALS